MRDVYNLARTVRFFFFLGRGFSGFGPVQSIHEKTGSDYGMINAKLDEPLVLSCSNDRLFQLITKAARLLRDE